MLCILNILLLDILKKNYCLITDSAYVTFSKARTFATLTNERTKIFYFSWYLIHKILIHSFWKEGSERGVGKQVTKFAVLQKQLAGAFINASFVVNNFPGKAFFLSSSTCFEMECGTQNPFAAPIPWSRAFLEELVKKSLAFYWNQMFISLQTMAQNVFYLIYSF